MENEIDANLDALGGAASRLNKLARATGEEVSRQNDIIDGITNKVRNEFPFPSLKYHQPSNHIRKPKANSKLPD